MEASAALMNAKLAERSVNAVDCRTRMASVVFSAGIDSVSGALSKPKKGGQHSCEKMLLATHREAATTSNKCNRLYLRKEIKRSTPVKETEKVGDLLTYALVQPAPSGKTNRFLCYQAREADGEWKLTLLYLEGPATLEDLRKMFEKQ